MADLKVTTTTTQTATGTQEQTASVDPAVGDQFQEQIDAARAAVDQKNEDEAKEQLKELNDEIDGVKAQLKEPNLPPQLKSQLRTVLNTLTEKRQAIYDEYPDLDPANAWSTIKVPQ